MRRRVFVLGLAGFTSTASLISFAQPSGKVPLVCYLGFGAGPETAFRQGLRELGYVEGKNILVEYRFAESRDERLAPLAAQITRLNPDVLVAADPPSLSAAWKATRSIPIVMRASTDPVATGIAKTLAHPGGNVTGMFSLYSSLTGKRMEILKETVPSVSRVMVLFDPREPQARPRLEEMRVLAKKLGMQLLPKEVRAKEEFDQTFAAAKREKADGLLLIRAPLLAGANKSPIANLAAKYALPAVYDEDQYVRDGGLLSYGADLRDISKRLAFYVDKILKGAKPGDLPIEQPTKFELVINLKTAKALGLKIPQTVLLRADQMIE